MDMIISLEVIWRTNSDRLSLPPSLSLFSLRLIFGVAVTMVAFGTKSNEKSLCSFTYRRHVMIGGILCIFHALFGIATYFTSAAFHHKTDS